MPWDVKRRSSAAISAESEPTPAQQSGTGSAAGRKGTRQPVTARGRSDQRLKENRRTVPALGRFRPTSTDWEVALELTVKGDPKSKARPRVTLRAGKPTAYTPAETVHAEKALARLLRQAAAGRCGDDLVDFRVTCQFSMTTHQRRDIDNMVKLVLDAGTKAGLWEDDCQVVGLVATLQRGVPEGLTEIRVECRQNSSRPRSTCWVCDISFDQRIGKRFCSRECREGYRAKLTCQQCGKKHTKHPSQARQYHRHFCSQQCYDLSRTAPEGICGQCGKAFKAIASRPDQQFCSQECRYPNAATGHCPEGHAYDYFDPRGGRQCKKCRRAAVLRSRDLVAAILQR